ncbi:vWA domain-containing protein [Nitrosopumilus sp.]|uniref:vWA domain-containing protein n=1 Tax=Nitrosopumilus sp. TaxID=2024843 RepID=UPI002613807E|nr:vWA domain-containing protein [Nitrosopumilus sp.]
MKDTIQDMAHQLFFEICDKKPIDIDTFFLDQLNFPRIDYEPRMTVYIPMPRQVQGIQALQGCAFIEDEHAYKTLFALYFASVCHSAGHAQVTNYSTYKKWISGKNKKRAFETMEFIEDIRVDEFLKNNFSEYYFEIKKIEDYFKILNEKKETEDKEKRTKKVFTQKFVSDIKIEREKIKQEILELSLKDKEKFIEVANRIYDSSNILTDDKLPFTDHYAHPKRIEKWVQNPKISVEGTFFNIVDRFGEVWIDQLKRRAKVKKKYGGITEDLEFDKIDFAPENIGEYLRLKNATHLFLKKMSSQIKMTPNVMDEGMPEDMGLLQMQAAIQAVASDNPRIQIFEQDDYRRIEEEWAIVVDTSSSMRLKFDEMKKFAICLGEAANEVNSKNGKWGFFTFNNNFTIVKDHYEQYDQNSKSRIGGIEIKGLSFIADAVKLCSRILDRENIERRYIFLITDGQALGTHEADTKMQEAIAEARKKGISVVAIGIPTGVTKIYSMCMPYEGLRKTVSKFLNAYTLLVGDDL